jgi:proteasome lid subunit RPN8/RPN11
VTLPALHLPATIVAAIVAQAQAAYPRECCGLLAGQAGRIVKHYPITNTYQGDDFYLMQPGEQYRALIEIDRQDWQLLVIYHSHPVSVAYP